MPGASGRCKYKPAIEVTQAWQALRGLCNSLGLLTRGADDSLPGPQASVPCKPFLERGGSLHACHQAYTACWERGLGGRDTSMEATGSRLLHKKSGRTHSLRQEGRSPSLSSKGSGLSLEQRGVTRGDTERWPQASDLSYTIFCNCREQQHLRGCVKGK